MKCKECICKDGTTKGICINPDSEHYTDFVKDTEGCKEGIEISEPYCTNTDCCFNNGKCSIDGCGGYEHEQS